MNNDVNLPVQLLKEADIKIGMDGRGRAQDNIFTERLWRTIKYEHSCNALERG